MKTITRVKTKIFDAVLHIYFVCNVCLYIYYEDTKKKFLKHSFVDIRRHTGRCIQLSMDFDSRPNALTFTEQSTAVYSYTGRLNVFYVKRIVSVNHGETRCIRCCTREKKFDFFLF